MRISLTHLLTRRNGTASHGPKNLAQDSEYSVLSISQFTLYGTIKKGTKPDFHKAAKGTSALPLYEEFLKKLREELGDETELRTENSVQ